MPSGNSGDEPEGLFLPNRRNLLKTLGVGGAVALAGCQGNQGDAEPTGTTQGTDTQNTETEVERTVGGDYLIGSSTDAETLYWPGVNDVPSNNRIGLTMDGLYALTSEQEVFPLWGDVSSDNMKDYTVTLRDNLQWSEPYGQLTAEDFVYTIKNVLQGEDNWAGFASRGDWFYTDADGNEQPIPVEQTGELEFTVHLNQVDPAYPKKPILWGMYAYPKGLLEEYVPDKDLQGLQQSDEVQTLSYTGNLGAYDYENWDRESEFVATRAENYYLRDADDVPERFSDAPYFEREIYKVIPEQSTRLASLKAGEITATGIPSTQAPQYEGSEGLYLNVAPQSFLTGHIYNMRMNGWAPFRDQAVRIALAHAVDKQAIAENIERGYAEPAFTFQPRYSQWYSDDQITQYGVGDTFDVDTARQQLSDALSGRDDYHYQDGTVVDNDGEAVTLRYIYTTGSGPTKTMAQYISQQYGKIGLNCELKGVRFNTLLSKYVANTYQGDGEPPWSGGPYNAGPRDQTASEQPWDMMIGIIFNTYPLTPTSTDVFWLQDASTNFYGYYPEAPLADWYEQASTATEQSERQEHLSNIFGALSEEQPENFLVMGTETTGYQESLAGPSEEWNYGWDAQSFHFTNK